MGIGNNCSRTRGRKNPGIPGEKQLMTRTIKRGEGEALAKRNALANEDQLVLLEGIIERGYQTFLEVGRALQEIRDNKLWKPRYASFDDYCRDRWKYGAKQAIT